MATSSSKKIHIRCGPDFSRGLDGAPHESAQLQTEVAKEEDYYHEQYNSIHAQSRY